MRKLLQKQILGSNNANRNNPAIQDSSVRPNDNFRITQKLCMPFMSLKKDEAIALGVEASDLKLPFGEIEYTHLELAVDGQGQHKWLRLGFESHGGALSYPFFLVDSQELKQIVSEFIFGFWSECGNSF
ncbi:hypothetical protein PanWU01x14_234430 [Parasponia andersonii]|uniref:Uncharacterized protein n=1 Tax=Parasponia andersonii TaxID=3476 RepID=A0A2P5BIX5_PARAD|nr:hypothetical protein PanWU01x14_234430 [Parasponia andersonii]